VLTVTSSRAHPLRAATGNALARSPVLPRVGWKSAGALALLCSTVAWASLPRAADIPRDEQRQWQALGISPLSYGGGTGMRMASTEAVEPILVAPERASLQLTATLGQDDSVRALLMRAGATYGDAAAAGELIDAAAPSLAAGTSATIELGARNGTTRSVERVELKGGLGETFVVSRAGGALRLQKSQVAIDTTPLRIRGRVGDGLYWSLRAAGASPQVAAQYLAALATQIDVGGDVGSNDSFDLILASRRAGNGERQEGALLYAGLDRAAAQDLQLVRWTANGRSQWIDAANAQQPAPVSEGMAWPVAGRITSYFGTRYHPILHFSRFHAGLDFGASWGSPIVAAADGQVVGAGWAGGYGRQVRIAHGGGMMTSYSHMSQIVAYPGAFVRRGQLIGYVGSSGLSTGPHLHYEVRKGGVAVNPLSVRFASAPMVDAHLGDAVKARLKALLSIGAKKG
jgi:murein DD-endopeptidase MepM/ murein hydrolase activator NlpD